VIDRTVEVDGSLFALWGTSHGAGGRLCIQYREWYAYPVVGSLPRTSFLGDPVSSGD
jgi:hypothetical protein